ncbi:MAG: glycosyltransferase family 4 protein [Promethearchaeota archaeon]
MGILNTSTILYVNQVRQENFEKLVGKGFSESLSWRETFGKIIFLCYSTTNKHLYKKLYNNFHLIGLPFDLSKSSSKSLINIGKNYLKILLVLFQISKVTKIDIIRMENLLLAGPPIYLFSKIKKIPYIIWFGGNERESLYIKYKKSIFTWLLAKLIIIFEKIILKNANFVFPVTDDLFNLAKKRNVKNLFLSPNFVDREKFKDISSKNDSKEKLHLLYVGRFEEEKGIRVLLEAIKILSKYSDSFELSMVGDGSLKEWVKNFLSLNQINNVQLLGTFNHDDMPVIYNSADIFILPSHTEGSPASLIEAMSCGTASIATSVGECAKIIKNGENGLLISPGNSKILSEALKALMESKNLQAKFRENGKISIKKYTMNYEKIHKYIYTKILKLFNK